jgi:hypothetical protein
MVDTDATVGGTVNRQSVVMIRNVTRIDADDEYLGLLGRVTAHNTALRKAEAKGYARHKCEDVGTMHAIGTRIPRDREGTPAPYAANAKVPVAVLCGLVVDLATLGSRCFPQVYSVIRDLEGDSGLLPVQPMDGVRLADDDTDEMTSSGGHEVLARPGLDTDPERGAELDDKSIVCDGGAREKSERCQRVGYSINMSVNLGNASHFDVHDASQGFSVWTEEVPGCGANWYFILPNVHGTKPDGRTKFRGIAVKLAHGVAISWDGPVSRHCTSVSHPDGMEGDRVRGAKDSRFHNHLFGTFSAAKERIVQAGRMLSAAQYSAPTTSGGDESGRGPRLKKKKTKKKTRRQRGRRSGQGELDDTSDAAETGVGVNGRDNVTESVVESSLVLSDHRAMMTEIKFYSRR